MQTSGGLFGGSPARMYAVRSTENALMASVSELVLFTSAASNSVCWYSVYNSVYHMHNPGGRNNAAVHMAGVGAAKFSVVIHLFRMFPPKYQLRRKR